MADALSFEKDIRPLFAQIDVDHMAFMMDLSSHDDVKANSDGILSVVKDGSMPPNGPKWTDEMCGKFQSWMEQGCPP